MERTYQDVIRMAREMFLEVLDTFGEGERRKIDDRENPSIFGCGVEKTIVFTGGTGRLEVTWMEVSTGKLIALHFVFYDTTYAKTWRKEVLRVDLYPPAGALKGDLSLMCPRVFYGRGADVYIGDPCSDLAGEVYHELKIRWHRLFTTTPSSEIVAALSSVDGDGYRCSAM